MKANLLAVIFELSFINTFNIIESLNEIKVYSFLLLLSVRKFWFVWKLASWNPIYFHRFYSLCRWHSLNISHWQFVRARDADLCNPVGENPVLGKGHRWKIVHTCDIINYRGYTWATLYTAHRTYITHYPVTLYSVLGVHKLRKWNTRRTEHKNWSHK